MRYSGLYFIPSPGNSPEASTNILNSILNSLDAHFLEATRQSQWTLFHRLLRSVPPPAPSNPGQPPQPPSQSQTLSYQHILHLSYLDPNKTYCYIHPSIPPAPTQPSQNVKGEPLSNAPTPQPPAPSQSSQSAPPTASTGTIISIPASQSDSHAGFLMQYLSPLWAFRHSLQIPHGLTFTTGQFTLHIGALQASRSGPSSSATLSPGVVICISTVAGASDFEDEGYVSMHGGSLEADDKLEELEELDGAEDEVRGFWQSLRQGLDFGKAEVREVMMGKDGLGTKGEREKEAAVRMWCELLRLRG